jgi:hypothetical protein
MSRDVPGPYQPPPCPRGLTVKDLAASRYSRNSIFTHADVRRGSLIRNEARHGSITYSLGPVDRSSEKVIAIYGPLKLAVSIGFHGQTVTKQSCGREYPLKHAPQSEVMHDG